MSSEYSKLKVTQVGGFAGSIALPPLVELDRAALGAESKETFDAACRHFAAAASAPAGATPLGADLPGYRVELKDEAGHTRSFLLPPVDGTTQGIDVPQLIASLQQAAGASAN